ncbi:MAG: patatin-like phospholipase family protein, partial [Pseudomonadota bacterium]
MNYFPATPLSGTAFVFAGGGSLGSIQVGMLKALLKAGINADYVVGSSVGAINAAFFAGDPTLEGVMCLEKIWHLLKRSDVYPVTAIAGMLKLFTGKDYLVDPSSLTTLIDREIPFRVLEAARIPCHVVATDLMDGQEVVMSTGPVTEALLASTAIPGVFPPVQRRGHFLIDGGVANHTPLSTAADLGAERIIVLPTGAPCTLRRPPKGIVEITLHSLNLMALRQLAMDAQHYLGQ